MNKNNVRSFAAGIFIATAILSFVYFQTEKDSTPASVTTTPVEMTENDVHAFASKNDLVLLTNEEFEQWQTKINELERETDDVEENENGMTIGVVSPDTGDRDTR